MRKDQSRRYAGFRTPGVRLKEEPLPDLLIHSSEQELPRLYACHMFDKAHLIMLAEEGIIPVREAASMLAGLRRMEADGVERTRLKAGGGIHSGEHYLISILGQEIGGKIHTGRSSGDLDAVADRISQRDRLVEVMEVINSLRGSLLKVSARHLKTVLPGYTHGQVAEPLTLAHQLLAWAATLSRDFGRMESAYERVNVSPAGAAIMTGSGFPVNRHRTSDLLGFDGPSENTLDAIHSPDAMLEVFSAVAILHASLSRWADDIILWSSSEVAMVDLPDRFCGTSSILPHKKNPYAMEHIRGAAAETVGGLMAAFSGEKGSTGMGIFSRNFYSRPALARAFDHVLRDLRWWTELIPAMGVNRALMEERSRASWATASELAGLIVREKGLSWRTAHQIVGVLVRLCSEKGKGPAEVHSGLLDEAASAYMGKPLGLREEDLKRALDPVHFVEARILYGGPSPEESKTRAARLRETLKADEKTVLRIRKRLKRASDKLERAVGEIISRETTSCSKSQ